MRHYSRWQTAAILGVTLLVSLAAVPNVLPASALERLPVWAQRTFVLGYDLQGGAHVKFEIDRNDVRRQVLESARDTMRNMLREQRVSFSGMVIRNGGVEAWIREPGDMPRAVAALEQLVGPFPAPAPAKDHRLRLTRYVDGRPSLWASHDASSARPDFKLDIADRMVRLTVDDEVYLRRIRQARDHSLNFLTRRVRELGDEKLVTISPLGMDRIVFDAKLDPGLFERLSSFAH